MNWEQVVAHALTLPGTELTTYYGGPAVKANGHPLVTPGREEGSFCLHIDQDTKAILIETDPGTFWQTPHYDGWPSLLVRYDSPDPERVLAMIDRSHGWVMSRKPPRPRKK
jgi:hypothetical protein